MTNILGLSAFYHDSAAALIVDGQIIAAAQEERFSRKKHDPAFPQRAIEYCLQQAQLTPADLDYVGFYDKPITKFERLLETYLAFAPQGYRSFRQAIPLWLKQKLHLPQEIQRGLNQGYGGRVVFTEHHESHAASAFFPSPFEQAAIVTMDGVGEWSTSCIGVGRGNRIQLHQEMQFPHSLGLLYSAFTYYTGFRVNSGEYKLMGLAPYGQPIYRDLILDNLIDLKEDGSFRLDMRYFNYCQGLTMTSPRFHRLLGGPPRQPESEITSRDMDVAASIQAVLEEIVLRTIRHAHQLTGQSNLVLAGGVALNCVANGRIQGEGPFENIWIQPAAGDAGGALGNALFIWHQLLERPRQTLTGDSQRGSLLGPSFSDSQIAATLESQQAVFKRCADERELVVTAARLIAEQKVVGWFQGRMEFGPRALGNRSILGDPRNPLMQSTMNLKIKFRESFRPFACAILHDQAHKVYKIRAEHESPYMLVVADLHDELRTGPALDFTRRNRFEQLDVSRSVYSSVTHVDYSSRLQSVDPHRNPLFHQLLSEFYLLTGCPLLINTSFNVRGEPIVCSPEDAWRCFNNTDMDALIIGQCVLLKTEQSVRRQLENRTDYLANYPLD